MITLAQALQHPTLRTLKPSCARTAEELEVLDLIRRYNRALTLLSMLGYRNDVRNAQLRDPQMLAELDEALRDPGYLAWLEAGAPGPARPKLTTKGKIVTGEIEIA